MIMLILVNVEFDVAGHHKMMTNVDDVGEVQHLRPMTNADNGDHCDERVSCTTH